MVQPAYKLNPVFHIDKIIINSDFLLNSIYGHFINNFDTSEVYCAKWQKGFEQEIIIDGNKYDLFIYYEVYYDDEKSEIYNLFIILVELFDKQGNSKSIDYSVLNMDIRDLITKMNEK